MIVEVGSVNWYEYIKQFGLCPDVKKSRRKTEKQRILNVFSAFDIETSTVWCNPDRTLHDVHSFMYTWQFQLEGYTVKGRTWESFFSWLRVLQDAIAQIGKDNMLSKNPLLVIWVHNLAFEWTFLSGLYPFTNDECFFRDVRKPIYCRMFETFEYRCSYIQTNLSLDALCKQTGVEMKLSGQKYDYEKIRFPWTELSEYEQEYCTRDVESLVKAMKYRLEKSGDTLVTVPLTSTGYVRRDCKAALADDYLFIRDLKPREKEYRLLRKAFRGGNTHANRYYVGKIVDDVYSYDISSSYPTQQLTQLFPMRPFKWLELEGAPAWRKFERIFTFIGLGYAVVGTYQFKNLRLINPREPIPYISLSRTESYGYRLDNGRILEAEYCEISMTEIDLKIVLEQYQYDELDILECMVAQKDYLPAAYRAVIQEYYNRKTALKGDDSEEGIYMYAKMKSLLNAVFGMSATDPIHQEIIYSDGEYTVSGYDSFTKEEILKLLKNASFCYQWGTYTTALARAQLQEAIKLCGDKILYCDTDSVKTAGPVNISVLNDRLKKAAITQNAFADDRNGKRHYIGLFEDDGHYRQFITQGAKRYAFIKDNGRMGITVAGVTKKIDEETVWKDEKGEEYNPTFAVEELKTLKRFKPGMVWKEAGGTISVYNDNDDFDYQDPASGKSVHITRNVAIVPTTYEMTYAKDYRLLLGEIQLYGDYKRSRE